MSNSPALIESLRNNGGIRSVTRATFPPGAKALLHYHSQYSETFLVHSGELTVTHNEKKHVIGDKLKSHTIPQREIHTYENNGVNDVVVDIILEPGHAGCEMTNDIIKGLDKDHKIPRLSLMGGYNILWAVLYDLTNTIPVGVSGLFFSAVRFVYGKRRIEKMQRDLIIRYCQHYYL